MTQNNNISDELKALSPLLAELPKILPYTVPEGYFDTALLAVLKRSVQSSASAIPLQKPDHNYFENLSSSVLSKIYEQDSRPEQHWPVAMPYTVQQEYFVQLPETILQRVKKPAKIIPMRWVLRIAASILIIAGAWGIFKYTQPDPIDYVSALSEISDNELFAFADSNVLTAITAEYLSEEIDDAGSIWELDIETSLSYINDDALEYYLNYM